jgi:pyruvate/2-oxoglutarate dehydrogenase complex dihydrolipoamide acyltransferase (E2) component
MDGVVVKVAVTSGDAVERDAVLVVLEAMKMQIPVTAPGPGQVRRLLVAEGDRVTAGQPLAEIGLHSALGRGVAQLAGVDIPRRSTACACGRGRLPAASGLVLPDAPPAPPASPAPLGSPGPAPAPARKRHRWPTDVALTTTVAHRCRFEPVS